jgi:hypothetical protein
MQRYTSDEYYEFIEYFLDFYGADGLYGHEVNYGRGYTYDEVLNALIEYLDTDPNAWGGGDTMDRERVAIILDPANAKRY